MEKEILKTIERKIGYKFKDENLLIQAFTRKSYTEENGGENNEVLEFVGDKALDLVIIKIMIERFGLSTNDERWISYIKTQNSTLKNKTKEGVLTELKRELVEKRALSKAIEDSKLNEYLIMGKGDFLSGVQNSKSVKEDLFESIVGAIAIDSCWNIPFLENSIRLLIDLDKFFSEKRDDLINYIGALQEATQGRKMGIPNYEIFETMDSVFKCVVTINGYGKSITSTGNSKSDAKMKAAEKMYFMFISDNKEKGELEKVIDRLTESNASMLFNEILSRGLIDTPFMDDSSNNLESPNQVFTFTIIDDVNKIKEIGISKSKKEAKNKACFLYLSRMKNIVSYSKRN